MNALTIRNVEVNGASALDVRIDDGLISEIGRSLAPRGEDLDGAGGALIPGLTDHHIHLMALAAQRDSIALDGVANRRTFDAQIRTALRERDAGSWLRVTGYHERMAGELGREELDAMAPRHPLRVQHQTGSLWILNSQALEATQAETDPADCIERDAKGLPTGRIWRGDTWLRDRLPSHLPDLKATGQRLASYGITAVTDTSATTDSVTAAHLASAVRDRALPLRLTLMSAGSLVCPEDDAFAVGALKILLDDHALPGFDDLIARIAQARSWKRQVAVHCVTAGELALTLAAFESSGASAGDRLEHGGMIPFGAIEKIRALGLTVVTQPSFIHERGDRYAHEIDPREHNDLYRCATLLRAGIAVAAGSDAPYASADPWISIRTAANRRTRDGRVLGAQERITAKQALNLYLRQPASPSNGVRKVEVGAPADLCLLKTPLREALDSPHADGVLATLLGGQLTYIV